MTHRMTSINDLPNELLVNIFSYTPWIDEIVTYSHVCQRWKHLSSQRLKLVKHLTPEPKNKNRPTFVNSRTISYIPKKTDNNRISDFIGLLCNIETLVISNETSPIIIDELLPKIARSYPGLKRLAIPYTPRKRRVLPFNQLEALSLPCFFRWFSGIVAWCREKGKTLKELHLKSLYGRQYELLFPNFTNLERLHLEGCGGIENFLDRFPVLTGVKTLEMEIPKEVYLNGILEKFPSLESLWLRIRKEQKWSGKLIAYPNLKHLVIDSILRSDYIFNIGESLITYLPLLFPNLKNLAVRNRFDFFREELFSLLCTLTNLEVLDVHGCIHIDQDLRNAAEECLKDSGRNIKLIFTKIEPYSTSHLGTDFMRDWFFRDFKNLPMFLVDQT